MKKLLAIISLMSVLLVPQISFAKKAKPIPVQDWVVVAQNKGGIYSYDKNSLVYLPADAQPQEVVEIKVNAKADILDKNFRQQLQDKYGKNLKDGDVVEQCFLNLILNKQKKTYQIVKVELISSSGKILIQKELEGKVVAIPPKTFVGVLLTDLFQPDAISKKNITILKNEKNNKGEQNDNQRFSENKEVPKK
jgi:hypothetical protein